MSHIFISLPPFHRPFVSEADSTGAHNMSCSHCGWLVKARKLRRVLCSRDSGYQVSADGWRLNGEDNFLSGFLTERTVFEIGLTQTKQQQLEEPLHTGRTPGRQCNLDSWRVYTHTSHQAKVINFTVSSYGIWATLTHTHSQTLQDRTEKKNGI